MIRPRSLMFLYMYMLSLIPERYLGRYNKLTNNSEGVAGWNGYYDSEGTLVITNCYDQDRNAVPVNNQ